MTCTIAASDLPWLEISKKVFPELSSIIASLVEMAPVARSAARCGSCGLERLNSVMDDARVFLRQAGLHPPSFGLGAPDSMRIEAHDQALARPRKSSLRVLRRRSPRRTPRWRSLLVSTNVTGSPTPPCQPRLCRSAGSSNGPSCPCQVWLLARDIRDYIGYYQYHRSSTCARSVAPFSQLPRL